MEIRLRRVLQLWHCVMREAECRTGATKLSGERTGPSHVRTHGRGAMLEAGNAESLSGRVNGIPL